MAFQKGDSVNYIPGYKGWHSATVIGFDSDRMQYLIELSNGKELNVWEDELEEE